MNEQMVLDHMKLASRMARRKSLSSPPSVSFDELESAAYMGLVDAASRFDPSRGFAFSSYAMVRIEGEMKDCMRKSILGGRIRLINEGEDFCDETPEKEDVDFSCLDAKEAKILRLYYFENRAMKEIGLLEGVGESRISQILASCRNKLKKHMSRRIG